MNSFQFNSTNTFCISLVGNNERREKMEIRLKKINLETTFWEASTKDTLTDTFAAYLRDGQKGCSQSHWNIWKYIIEKDMEYALILEDDACFDKQFFEKLNKFKTEISDEDYDAIFLNASEPEVIKNTWVLTKEQFLTGGYILSLKGAKRLLHTFSDCLHSADWMTSRLQLNEHSYTYFPWLIIQEGNESTIGSSIQEDHEKVLRILRENNYSLDNYIL